MLLKISTDETNSKVLGQVCLHKVLQVMCSLVIVSQLQRLHLTADVGTSQDSHLVICRLPTLPDSGQRVFLEEVYSPKVTREACLSIFLAFYEHRNAGPQGGSPW